MKYDTSKQYLRRLKFEQFKKFLKNVVLLLLGSLTAFILYICITSDQDTQKLNKCLQNHNLDYCNKNIK